MTGEKTSGGGANCATNIADLQSAGKHQVLFKKPQPVRHELLKIDGRMLEVRVRLNPRARRMIVKVNPATGEVSVTAPSRRGLSAALDFARGERDWIARQLAKAPGPIVLSAGAEIPFHGIAQHRYAPPRAGPRLCGPTKTTIWVRGDAAHAPRRVLDFLKREARKTLEARVLAHAARLGVKPSRITVRDTASRWGSCSTTRALVLLLAADPRARLRARLCGGA